jgi:hypothetical protein
VDPSYDKPKTNAHQLALRVTAGRDEGKVFPLVEGFIGKKAIIEMEKIISGELSKTVLLRRIAVGKVTDMTTRIARARISAPSEPMKAGMKVFSGLQTGTLTLTSERLSSIDKGL